MSPLDVGDSATTPWGDCHDASAELQRGEFIIARDNVPGTLSRNGKALKGHAKPCKNYGLGISCNSPNRRRWNAKIALSTLSIVLMTSPLETLRGEPMVSEAKPRESVVLLHGWWSSPLTMKRLEWRLRQEGYRVINLGYPSVRTPLEAIARDWLPRELEKTVPRDGGPVHFVTHSMGGIVLREFLEAQLGWRPGRIVLIAPPNHGSSLADWWSRWKLCRWLAGPNLERLQTQSHSAKQAEMPVAYEVGILAGDRFIPTLLPGLKAPHDGRVTVESTRLAGMKAHTVVHCMHSFLPWHPRVAVNVVQFLDTGEFLP